MKTGKLLLLILSIVLFASSCKNTMDLTKRRYTKGYYFHKNSPSGKVDEEGIARSITKEKTKQNKPTIETKAIAAEKATESIEENQKEESYISYRAVMAPESKSEVADIKHKAKIERKVKPTKPATATQSKKHHQKSGGSADSDVKLILLIILALFIPPLAMYLWDKQTDTWFIVDLVLFILAFSWFFLGPLGLLGLTSIIIAILRILDVI